MPFSAGDDIEKIPSRALLDLDDPDVRIEFDLTREIGLDRRVGRRPLFKARAEGAVGAGVLPVGPSAFRNVANASPITPSLSILIAAR